MEGVLADPIDRDARPIEHTSPELVESRPFALRGDEPLASHRFRDRPDSVEQRERGVAQPMFHRHELADGQGQLKSVNPVFIIRMIGLTTYVSISRPMPAKRE